MTTAPFVPGSTTSQAAAASLSPSALNQLERQVLDEIERSGQLGCTDKELEQRCKLSHETTSARRRTLVLKGFVKDSGLKRPTPSGRDATIWVLGVQDRVRAGPDQPDRPARPSNKALANAVTEIKRLVELGRSQGIDPSEDLQNLGRWLLALVKD
jgi:hypothetical protein